MERWQDALHQSITTVDELVARFGAEHIDREAVEKAIDKFNLRITPAALAAFEQRRTGGPPAKPTKRIMRSCLVDYYPDG